MFLAVAISGLCLAGDNYGLLSFPKPGLSSPTGIGVAKVVQVNVTGSAVAAGTVILSRVSADSATTNDLITVTCSSGAVTYNETNSVYLFAGDKILRGGTATNGTCRVVVAQ